VGIVVPALPPEPYSNAPVLVSVGQNEVWLFGTVGGTLWRWDRTAKRWKIYRNPATFYLNVVNTAQVAARQGSAVVAATSLGLWWIDVNDPKSEWEERPAAAARAAASSPASLRQTREPCGSSSASATSTASR
jgi:sugar lactone lactonase YvrE